MNEPTLKSGVARLGETTPFGRFDVIVLEVNSRAVKLGIRLPSGGRDSQRSESLDLSDSRIGHYLFSHGQRLFVVTRSVGQRVRLSRSRVLTVEAVDGNRVLLRETLSVAQTTASPAPNDAVHQTCGPPLALGHL